MPLFDTDVQELKNQVLREVAALTFEDQLTPENTLAIAEKLIPEGKPRMLAQGCFTEAQQLLLTLQDDPSALYAWQLQLPHSESTLTLRLLLPDNVDPGQDTLQCYSNSGWKTVSYTQDGSYLVFSCAEDCTQLRIVDVPADYMPYWIAGGATLLVIAGIIAIAQACRARKKKSA